MAKNHSTDSAKKEMKGRRGPQPCPPGPEREKAAVYGRASRLLNFTEQCNFK